MKRLGVVDGLLFALSAIFVLSLALGLSGQTPKAEAALGFGPYWWCAPPAICPAVSGTCGTTPGGIACGANPGLTGVCIQSSTFPWTCSYLLRPCQGLDSTTKLGCSCASSGC